MKRFIVFLSTIFLLTSISLAANARGLVFRNGPYGMTYPVPSTTVILRDMNGQNASSPALTGIDGMYYFYNMFPGNYFLDLYSGEFFIGRFLINISNTPMLPGVFSDIPPVGIQ